MIVSLNWLKQYVDVKASPEEIAEALTFLGIEVEKVHRQAEHIRHVVSANVLQCRPHPNADRLTICRVTDGSAETSVVCGAPNVAEGQVVLLARVGAVLEKGFKLKKSTIRGVQSHGMICAEDELGLGNRHAGILVLPSDTPLGKPLQDIPGLCDVQFELSVTPNRPDILSHLGVARELSAFYKLPLIMPSMEGPEADFSAAPDIRLEVKSPDDCSLYIGRVIRNVKVGPSPEWLVKALTAVGQNSINNVVDITNYVLFELGQPSHAFDLDKLTGPTVTIRRGTKSESLTTLDEVEREISESDMVIADSSGPVCLAGVIGGERTRVDTNTKALFLETAYFSPRTVRRQARRHGISTDSSYRFERGVNPLSISRISDYLCRLLVNLTGGRLVGQALVKKAPAHPGQENQVPLRISRLEKVLGVSIEEDEVVSMLKGIQIVPEQNCAEKGNYLFNIPGFRPDITREIDLIEEAARLYNFNNIPMALPAFPLSPAGLPPAEKLAKDIRVLLAAFGLKECISLRFSAEKYLDRLLLPGDSQERKAVAIRNPLSEEWEIAVTSLIPALLNAVHANQNNSEEACRLFEVGKVFYDRAENRSEKDPGVLEVEKVTIVIAGEWNPCTWQTPSPSADFYTLKGLVENLLAGLHFPAQFAACKTPFLHPKESVSIRIDGREIGFAGSLHPQAAANYRIGGYCGVAELNLTELLKNKMPPPQFRSFSHFATIRREMNIVVDESITHEMVVDWMELSNVKHLESVRLNSIYRGKELNSGKKAMHFSFVYRHPHKTLTDEAVNRIQEKLALKLAKNPAISYK